MFEAVSKSASKSASKLGRASVLLGLSLLFWQRAVSSGAAEESLVPIETPSELTELERAEIPEEILRTEIITGARSPLTGEPLTAAEYAQLQATLEGPQGTPLVSEDLRYLIFLLQVRRAVRPILPFIK